MPLKHKNKEKGARGGYFTRQLRGKNMKRNNRLITLKNESMNYVWLCFVSKEFV